MGDTMLMWLMLGFSALNVLLWIFTFLHVSKEIKNIHKSLDLFIEHFFKLKDDFNSLNLLLKNNFNSSTQVQQNSTSFTKLPPANRKPRSEDQKKLASEKQRAYWARIREEKQREQGALPATVVLDSEIRPSLTS